MLPTVHHRATLSNLRRVIATRLIIPRHPIKTIKMVALKTGTPKMAALKMVAQIKMELFKMVLLLQNLNAKQIQNEKLLPKHSEQIHQTGLTTK